MSIRNPRQRILVILAIVFAVYVLLGFFLVPPILKSQIQKHVHAATGRSVTLGAVRFNPLVLSLTLRDFCIHGKKGEDFVGWEELYLNFQTSSLFRLAWTFDEISWIKPSIYIERLTADEFNFSDMLRAETEPSPPPEETEDQGNGILPLRIGKLVLDEGSFRFRDSSRGRPADLHLASLSFQLDDFSTRLDPDESNAYGFKAYGPKGGLFHWKGNFRLTPLESEGLIELSGIDLSSFVEFYQDEFQFALPKGQFSFITKYHLFSEPEWGVELEEGDYTISDFMVQEKISGETILVLPLFNIKDVALSTAERRVFVEAVTLKGGELNAVLDDQGAFNVVNAIDFSAFDAQEGSSKTPAEPPGASAPVPGQETSETSPKSEWYWEVSRFNLDGFDVGFTDHSIETPLKLSLSPLNIQVEEIVGDGHKPFNLSLSGTVNEKASLELSGSGTVQPVSLALDIDGHDLRLVDFQPYVDRVAHITITDGMSESRMQVQLGTDDNGDLAKLHVTGNTAIVNLSIMDNVAKRKLVEWQRVSVEDMTLDAIAGKLNIGRVLIAEPSLKIQINEDKTSNIQELVVTTPPDQSEPTAQERAEDQFAISIDEIVVENGTTSFADLSLTPDFVTQVDELNGRITGASSTPGQTSDVKLSGKVDRYAPVAMQGKSNLLVDPPYLDLAVLFENMEMSSFTPYSGTYAGQKIDRGQLSLDLHYLLEDNLLHGDNNIVINKLELGEKVESDQAVHLPLKLAVALLSDVNGVIDLDFGVDGDVNDPEFSVGGIVWKVLQNIIVKAATSPFNLLAGLVGGEGNLDVIGFAPGSSDLGEQEKDKVMQLTKALEARPQLSLNVHGQVAYASDLQSLKQKHLNETLASLSGLDLATLGGVSAAGQERSWRKALFGLYKKSSGESWRKVRRRLSDEAKARGEELDKETLLARTVNHVYEDLAGRQPITDENLHTLANARAQAVKAALVEDHGIDSARVFVLVADIDPSQNASEVLLTVDAL